MLFPVDHGNSSIKTVNFVFSSGLADYPIRPPVDTDILEYGGKYWTLSGKRISYLRDKTKDDRYFILTLFAIAQRIWDLYSPKSHINLIVCGSIYSMMTKIFKDKKEPLYNRQSRFMTVRPFTPTVLKDILSEYNPGYTAEDLLALYAFTGGVAKYVQLLVDAEATPKTAMLDQLIKADSIFPVSYTHLVVYLTDGRSHRRYR